MSNVFSLICLSPSIQKMTHHFLPHGSLWPTNLEKSLKPLKENKLEADIKKSEEEISSNINNIDDEKLDTLVQKKNEFIKN